MKTLAIVLVVLIAVVVLLKVLMRVAAARLAGSLGTRIAEKLAAAQSSAATPVRITLCPEPEPEWEHAADVDGPAQQLLAAGFTDAGQFSVNEIPGLYLRAFAHQGESVWAVVYDHAAAGVWTDIVIRYEDDTALTVGNPPTGGQMVSPPWSTMILDSRADAAALFQKALQAAEDKPRQPVSADTFVEVFTRAYAREMDWRNLRGGASEEEIRRVAADDVGDYDSGMIAQAQEQARAQAAEGVTVLLTEKLLEHRQLSEEERYRLLVVHDRLEGDMLRDAVETALEGGDVLLDEDYGSGKTPAQHMEDDLDPDAPVRESFSRFNAGLPEAVRFERIWEVQEPLPAEFYLAPEDSGE